MEEIGTKTSAGYSSTHVLVTATLKLGLYEFFFQLFN